MAYTKYTLGTMVTADVVFAVDGVPADPTAFDLVVARPDNDDTVYHWPDPPGPQGPIVRDSAGTFHADLLTDVKGIWTYRFVSSGTGTTAAEGTFQVVSDVIEGLDLLVAPEDWDAIRAVLGVTEYDLTNDAFERALFAGQAELRVKNRITDWSTIIIDPDKAFILRMAAAYAVGALVAESYARGGTIDNVAPNNDAGGGTTHGWTTHAKMLWTRHEEWMAIAEAWDLEPGDIYDLHAMKASGPTKAAARNAPSRYDVPGWATALGVYWDGWTL